VCLLLYDRFQYDNAICCKHTGACLRQYSQQPLLCVALDRLHLKDVKEPNSVFVVSPQGKSQDVRSKLLGGQRSGLSRGQSNIEAFCGLGNSETPCSSEVELHIGWKLRCLRVDETEAIHRSCGGKFFLWLHASTLDWLLIRPEHGADTLATVKPYLVTSDIFLWGNQRQSFVHPCPVKCRQSKAMHHNSCCEWWRAQDPMSLERIRLSYCYT
jgi:hypothetical protein